MGLKVLDTVPEVHAFTFFLSTDVAVKILQA